MTRKILVSSRGLSDWQAGLAKPEKQWRRGFSAYELAVTWEIGAKNPNGLPVSVSELLDQQNDTQQANLLFAVPEHKVAVPGKGYASQTDVWALLRSQKGLISLAVEGKVNESFGVPVEKWLGAVSSEETNKSVRSQGLCQKLNISISDVGPIYYQLLHRAYSAVAEAERYGAPTAVLLVQSFGGAATCFEDFQAFAEQMGVPNIAPEQLQPTHPLDAVKLYVAWANCPFVTDSEVDEVTLMETQVKAAEGFAASGMTVEALDDSVFDLPLGQARAEIR